MRAIRDLDAARRGAAGDCARRPRRSPPICRISCSCARSIAAERDDLAGERGEAARRAARLEALIDARQKSAMARREEALDAERARAGDLADQAASLKDLIARMERRARCRARGADVARKADEARSGRGAAPEARRSFATVALQDPARLAPAIAFAEAKGMLSLPAPATLSSKISAPPTISAGSRRASRSRPARAPLSSAPSDGYIAFTGP